MAGVWPLRIPSPVSCWFSGVALVCHPPLGFSLPCIYITYEIGVTYMHDEYRMDTPGFPANSQLHSPTSPSGGAAPLACQGVSYLRHFCYLHCFLQWRSGHFCRSPHVAMRFGLSHHIDPQDRVLGVQSLRVPTTLAFPADCPHRSRCHCSSPKQENE